MTNTSFEDQLVGSWALVTYVQSFDDGRADVLPMGGDPSGLILYTADGHMSAQLGPRNRANFASDVITDGVDDEYARAARTYIAYSGRFSCDAAAGTVIHHVQVALFPNWVGGDQVRRVSIDGDLLNLSSIRGAPGNRPGAIQTLTWRRT